MQPLQQVRSFSKTLPVYPPDHDGSPYVGPASPHTRIPSDDTLSFATAVAWPVDASELRPASPQVRIRRQEQRYSAVVRYDAWVECVDNPAAYGQTELGGDGRTYGRLGSEQLSSEQQNLPDGGRAFKRSCYDRAYRAIAAAYPEARAKTTVVENGVSRVVGSATSWESGFVLVYELRELLAQSRARARALKYAFPEIDAVDTVLQTGQSATAPAAQTSSTASSASTPSFGEPAPLATASPVVGAPPGASATGVESPLRTPDDPMLVLMGPSEAGKTAVGAALPVRHSSSASARLTQPFSFAAVVPHDAQPSRAPARAPLQRQVPVRSSSTRANLASAPQRPYVDAAAFAGSSHAPTLFAPPHRRQRTPPPVPRPLSLGTAGEPILDPAMLGEGRYGSR
jgi:hypothetical protein